MVRKSEYKLPSVWIGHDVGGFSFFVLPRQQIHVVELPLLYLPSPPHPHGRPEGETVSDEAVVLPPLPRRVHRGGEVPEELPVHLPPEEGGSSRLPLTQTTTALNPSRTNSSISLPVSSPQRGKYPFRLPSGAFPPVPPHVLQEDVSEDEAPYPLLLQFPHGLPPSSPRSPR